MMDVRQGFKRLPNLADIESDGDQGQDQGWDRSFHLFATPGVELGWHGDGFKVMRTELQLRIRMGKFSRLHDWTSAAFTNLAIIRAVLPRQELYPSTVVKALFSATDQQSEIVKDDDQKVVALDKYTLVYAVDGTYK